ncbi:MAG: hypothetical protein ACOY3Y_13170 [Acidobacteriota bacterium]
MPLLKPLPERNERPPLKPNGAISCPYNGHQVGWCRGLCQPLQGLGACGRVAPHALVSRIQEAIAHYEGRGLQLPSRDLRPGQ